MQRRHDHGTSRPRLAADEEQHHARRPRRRLRPAAARTTRSSPSRATSAPSRRMVGLAGRRATASLSTPARRPTCSRWPRSKELHGGGEIIVPTLTWVSDIAAVLHCGFTPVFVDIDPRTLGMDTEQVLAKITPRTRAVFLTHVLGYNALTRQLLDELAARGVPLIEDVCESHGATFEGRKLGSFGLASNFSFYYAHHLSTVEGGMVCTDDADLYETVRMLRSHGMVRELESTSRRREFADEHPDLNPDFIFAFPATTCAARRSTPSSAGRSCTRLDDGNRRAHREPPLFLDNLDPDSIPDRFCHRRQQQLRLDAGPAASPTMPCAAGDGGAASARRRVPPRHGGRRQPAAPAVPDAAAGAGSLEGIPAGRPRPFLRLLHRQLSDSGKRENPPPVRPAQRLRSLPRDNRPSPRGGSGREAT